MHIKRLVPALALIAASVVVLPPASVTQATSCGSGYTASSAWSYCTGMPAGYKHRVRAHYTSCGPGCGAGYAYGNWYGNGVQSNVYHPNINYSNYQLCAGAGC